MDQTRLFHYANFHILLLLNRLVMRLCISYYIMCS